MMEIQELTAAQRAYFNSGRTLPVPARVAALEKLRSGIRRHEAEITAALKADLNKAPMESYMTEIGMVLDELGYLIRMTPRWAREKQVPTPLAQFRSVSLVHPEPYGVALVMSPWNYPFMLALEPMAGALAAGNCVVVKPSAYAAETSRVIGELVGALFDPGLAAVVQGGRAENQALLDQPFDTIFFTGGTQVGRLVLEKAAVHFTPVTLEMGGKSPCIVDKSANIRLAARRLAFGKFLNAGQTCVAPDYVLVHRDVKAELVSELKKSVTAFFGPEPLNCEDYPKIINEKHMHRLLGLLEGANILFGGEVRGERMAPTVLDGVDGDSPVMGEEIFGPILPLLEFTRLDEAVCFIRSRPKPLALYLFTTDKGVERRVLDTVSFGGGCVNDCVVHLATHRMPFGGVGSSGMGSYHGRASFDTFSHYKSVLKKANWLDLPMRYHPYTQQNFRLIRKFLR